MKYTYDTTLYHVTSDVNDIPLQEAVNVATYVSEENDVLE